jgi:hypothetical protein
MELKITSNIPENLLGLFEKRAFKTPLGQYYPALDWLILNIGTTQKIDLSVFLLEKGHYKLRLSPAGINLAILELHGNDIFSEILDANNNESRLKELKEELIMTEICTTRLFDDWEALNEGYSIFEAEHSIFDQGKPSDVKKNAELGKITDIIKQDIFLRVQGSQEIYDKFIQSYQKFKNDSSAVGWSLGLLASNTPILNHIYDYIVSIPVGYSIKQRTKILFTSLLDLHANERLLKQAERRGHKPSIFYPWVVLFLEAIMSICDQKPTPTEIRIRPSEVNINYPQGMHNRNGIVEDFEREFLIIPYIRSFLEREQRLGVFSWQDKKLSLPIRTAFHTFNLLRADERICITIVDPNLKYKDQWILELSKTCLKRQFLAQKTISCPVETWDLEKDFCEHHTCTACMINDYIQKTKKISENFSSIPVPSWLHQIINTNPLFDELTNVI